MFTISAYDEYGYGYTVETFPDVDSLCDAINSLQDAQDRAFSHSRECYISELKSQLADAMEEQREE